jgi:DNA polymerase-3 subunit alpha
MLRVVRTPRFVVRKESPFFHLHAHSKYSHRDAISNVADMVAKAVSLGQKGLALTDHGNMAGSVQLYKACSKAGIAPFTGSEMYFVKDRQDKKAKRFHLGLVAYTTEGYLGLTQISSYTHRRESFHHKPLLDWADLAQFKANGWLDGVLITTGCFFGVLVQTLITEGYEAARHTLYRLMQMGRTVVELQKHLIDQEPLSEDAICEALYALAAEVGAPVVVTQDSHYVEAEDKPIHEALKRVVAFGDDPDEAVFPGDGFHLCDARWMADHHEPEHMAASDSFLKGLLSDHKLSIPELDTYHYQIPAIVKNPDQRLRELVTERLHTVFHAESPPPKIYYERLEEELSVYADTGMAGYPLLVAEFTDWMRANKIFFQARGSAAGSMGCWLLGITPVDPIKHKLLFERFMSRDRTKPPDIDLDIEDQRREEALEWLMGRFASTRIGSHARFTIDDEEGTGSLMVAYMKRARGLGLEIGGYKDLPQDLKDEMIALSERETYKGPGKNAAGIVIGEQRSYLARVLPMMGIPTGKDGFSYVTQYGKDDVENMGIVKLDAMGLKSLTALRNAYELVKGAGIDYGEDLQHIPLSDDKVFAMLRRGETEGIFQLEGYTASKGCREVKIRSLKDIVNILGVYRPAPMERDPETGISGKDLFIARREGREKMPERHPLLTTTLKDTYGLFIWQEQVIAVLRGLGFTPDDLTAFLKAVKASNADVGSAGKVIAGYEDMLRELSAKAGLSMADVDFIWSGLRGFAGYSFNRAHATVYGITAYRTAYFKHHHPLEFATAILQTWAGHPKETKVVATVRSMRIRISAPHVNVSGANYSIDRGAGAVRRALVSIHGVGIKAAEEIALHAPYDSIEDMVKRCDARRVSGGKQYTKDKTLNGTLEKLSEAGALKGLD